MICTNWFARIALRIARATKAPIFGFGLADPRARGVGVDPCLLIYWSSGCGLAGDVCDRKSQRLRLRLLVLSGLVAGGWFVPSTGIRRGESTRKDLTQNKKSSSERVFLNNSRWVLDSCHRKAGKSSRKLFEKARVNAVFFWYFGILGGFFGLYGSP